MTTVSEAPLIAPAPDLGPEVSRRAEGLFRGELQRVYERRDRVLMWLILLQWACAIAMAAIASPRNWAGGRHVVHVHVYYAIFLGGALSAPAVLLTHVRPGSALTRHVIAASQMLWSALLIHLSGGRIETHFHVFGSLAFLAFYRDWKVLITATLVVVTDHLFRGMYFPESVYGIVNPEWWRFLEHAGWVAFEDVVLVMGIRENHREMRTLASRQAELEHLNARIEEKVVEARDRAVQSEKMAAIGQLASGIAHEINNPLGVILGFAQGMERRVPEGDPYRLPVSSIAREAIRCKKLVQELLTFSRAGKKAIEPVDLAEIIRATAALLEARARTQNVQIEVEADGAAPMLGNRTQLQQIIVNLGTNALDAMKTGGVIRISCAADQSALRLVVQDTGTGIPEAIRARVFEPFFTTKGVGEGTGLGLSLVYEIVTQHQGRIELSSPPGEGAKFVMTFPLPVTRGVAA